MKSSQAFRRAVGGSVSVFLLLGFVGGAPSSYAESDIVAVGKTGSRYVYKVKGLFVVASVGNVIGGCVVRSSGALDCQGGASPALSDVEGRPGAIAETLSRKNRMLQEQSQRLDVQRAELDEMRQQLADCGPAPAAAFPAAPQDFEEFEAPPPAPAPAPAGSAETFEDEEVDLNF